jgi:hypothetical protein
MDLKSAPLLETTVSKAYVGQAVIGHVAHMPGSLEGVTPSVYVEVVFSGWTRPQCYAPRRCCRSIDVSSGGSRSILNIISQNNSEILYQDPFAREHPVD